MNSTGKTKQIKREKAKDTIQDIANYIVREYRDPHYSDIVRLANKQNLYYFTLQDCIKALNQAEEEVKNE